MVGSLFFLMFCIGGFLAGPLNKYLTLRWALLILAAIWSVVMLPLVLGASLAMLIVSRMLLGFAEGPSSALMHTAAYSWHPPAKRGLPGAMLAGSASVAKIALAPVLTFIAVHYGWRAAVLSLSVLGLVWMGLLAGRLVRGPVHEQGRQGDQDCRYRSNRGSRDSHEGGHRAQCSVAQDPALPHLRQLLLPHRDHLTR